MTPSLRKLTRILWAQRIGREETWMRGRTTVEVGGLEPRDSEGEGRLGIPQTWSRPAVLPSRTSPPRSWSSSRSSQGDAGWGTSLTPGRRRRRTRKRTRTRTRTRIRTRTQNKTQKKNNKMEDFTWVLRLRRTSMLERFASLSIFLRRAAGLPGP